MTELIHHIEGISLMQQTPAEETMGQLQMVLDARMRAGAAFTSQ